jgi:hypothetical protein
VRVVVCDCSALHAEVVGVLLAFRLFPGAIRADEPIRVLPHPGAGKSVRTHDQSSDEAGAVERIVIPVAHISSRIGSC